MMMHLIKGAAVLGLVGFLAFTAAASADEAAIRKNLQARFPGIPVDHVGKTPVQGLYEVVVEGRLMYSDENGNYLVAGPIIDTRTKRNLTEERVNQLFRANFDALPLDKAIKVVKGNGKRKMVVFSDPDCPFCRRLENELQSVTNVTIYTLLFPIDSLHPAASDHAKAIWCAPDRVKAWNDMMLKGVAPAPAGPSCTTPLAQIAEVGQKLRVNGTPTIVFADGRIVPGAVPAAQLEKYLDAAAN